MDNCISILIMLTISVLITAEKSELQVMQRLLQSFAREDAILQQSKHKVIKFEPGYHAGNFIYHKELKTWDEATAICAIQGSHLAVTSFEESKGLATLLSKRGIPFNAEHNQYVLVGFHDRNTPGMHETVLGHILDDMSPNWAYGEPKILDSCGSVDINVDLRTIHCNVTSAFLCERR